MDRAQAEANANTNQEEQRIIETKLAAIQAAEEDEVYELD